MVVTGMRMSADLERMGDLARHVAKVARLRYPDSAVPADIRATILQMGQVAERIVAKCGQVIAAKDVEDAKTLERDDDAMDELHRTLFSHLIDGTWKHGTEAAVDMTLVGSLLRAVRRPRRVGRPPRRLPGHRRVGCRRGPRGAGGPRHRAAVTACSLRGARYAVGAAYRAPFLGVSGAAFASLPRLSTSGTLTRV